MPLRRVVILMERQRLRPPLLLGEGWGEGEFEEWRRLLIALTLTLSQERERGPEGTRARSFGSLSLRQDDNSARERLPQHSALSTQHPALTTSSPTGCERASNPASMVTASCGVPVTPSLSRSRCERFAECRADDRPNPPRRRRGAAKGAGRKRRRTIAAVAGLFIETFRNGNKILFCGNGGTRGAQHIAAEFVGRFLLGREALPAIALTTDTLRSSPASPTITRSTRSSSGR